MVVATVTPQCGYLPLLDEITNFQSTVRQVAATFKESLSVHSDKNLTKCAAMKCPAHLGFPTAIFRFKLL